MGDGLTATAAVAGVIATSDTPRSIAGSVLQRLVDAFAQLGHERLQGAGRREGGLQGALGAKIKHAVESGGAGPTACDAVAAQTAEVRDVVIDHIDKLLQRGERIESVAAKSEQLQAQSKQFQKLGGQVHAQLWWQSKKSAAIFAASALLVALVAGLVVAGVLGFLQPR